MDAKLATALTVLITENSEYVFAKNNISPEEAVLIIDGISAYFQKKAYNSLIKSMVSAPESEKPIVNFVEEEQDVNN